MNPYYSEQIITYMGNKRKIIPHIERIIQIVKLTAEEVEQLNTASR